MRPFLTTLAGFALLAAAILSANAGPSILVDANTGKVLAQEDAHHRWYPASLTKLMTTYVAFRAVKEGLVTLASPVTISANAAKEPPSKMGYPVGTVLTLDNALKIIMVKSANDVATAIGESLAGSEAAFAARMNAEAKRIGMSGSNFVNAHGLHSDAQYSTARDLAVLALTLRAEFPEYAPYFSIEAIGAGESVMETHNNLIGRFEGADGMKTGYTCPSGFNLVATATRNGRTMLAVVIGAVSVDSRADKAAGLLSQGFSTPASTAGFTLSSLPAPDEGLDRAINMRDTVCAPQPKKPQAKDAAGKPVVAVRSPFRAELAAPRNVIPILLGGATGPRSPYAPEPPKFVRPTELKGIPIPVARPDYTAAETSAQAPADGVTQ